MHCLIVNWVDYLVSTVRTSGVCASNSSQSFVIDPNDYEERVKTELVMRSLVTLFTTELFRTRTICTINIPFSFCCNKAWRNDVVKYQPTGTELWLSRIRPCSGN